MFSSRKKLDEHVHKMLAKVPPGPERDRKGYSIGRMYYKINEYAKAIEYLNAFLKITDEAGVHTLLAKCYQLQSTPDNRKALEHLQRSIQLHPKQPDVIKDACQLLYENSALCTPEKASYWLELADRIEDLKDTEMFFALKLRAKGKTAPDGADQENSLEMILHKEMLSRPNDITLHVRLLRNYLETKRFDEAFNYANKVEMEKPAQSQSSDWYDIIWKVLQKREQSNNPVTKDLSHWQLLFICHERLIHLSMQSQSNGSLTDCIAQVFRLDQYLHKFSLLVDQMTSTDNRELHQCCLDHYTGQFLLHAASLLFKRELSGKKNQWSTTVRLALPLLLLGYQRSSLYNEESFWERRCNAEQHKLLQLWRRQAAFRCAQLGRTLYGCLQTAPSVDDKEMQVLWPSTDKLLDEVRQNCADHDWRSKLYQVLYTHSEHKLKEQTSQLMRDQRLQHPVYECPSIAEIEHYEQVALLLEPHTLYHHVYLALGANNLAEAPRVRTFKNLRHECLLGITYCGIDSVCQVDVEVFLYFVVLQAQRKLQVQRESYNGHYLGNLKATTRPQMLPYANIMECNDLVTPDQCNWWSYVQRMENNNQLIEASHRSDHRERFKRGLEALRGVGGPQAEIIAIFKVAKLLTSRADKSAMEARIDALYKLGLNMLRRHQHQQLEPFYRFFNYENIQASDVWLLTQQMADDAVNYLSARCFKNGLYEELLSDIRGLQLPSAAYFQAEAYRQMAESNRTSRVARQNFHDRRMECLQQARHMLANQADHPLHFVIQRELKASQADETFASPDLHNNSSTYEDAEDDFYAGTPAFINRSRRQVEIQGAAAMEFEQNLKQLCKQFCALKDNLDGGLEGLRQDFKILTENVKVDDLRKDIKTVNEKLNSIEDMLKKLKVSGMSRDTPTGDVDAAAAAAALGLDEFFNMDDNQQANFLNTVPPLNAPPHPNANYGSPMFNQNQMYNYYANQAQFMRTPPAQPNFYGQRAAANFTMQAPTMYPAPGGAPFMDSLNYGMPAPPPSLVMPQVSQAQPGLPASVQQNPPAFPGVGFFNSPFAQVPQQQPAPAVQQKPITVPAPTAAVASGSVPATVPAPVTVPVPAPVLPAVAPALAPAPVAAAPVASAPAPAPAVFNRALNNQPVEKEPPANVVITSSDPLPKPAFPGSQPTLSVTIPPQHIKPSLVQPTEPPSAMASSDFNFVLGNNNKDSGDFFKGLGTFSFKTQVAQAAAEKQKELAAEAKPNNESVHSEGNQSTGQDASAELDYDPRPDFQGIIPLPDEVEVRTGEEDEEIKFSHRAKLFRLVDKEWKERGIGDIKILKNQSTGSTRILMRREQTHKICANHKITAGMVLTTPEQDKEGKSFLWVANDFADEKLQLEKFLVRFKLPETAKEFKSAFLSVKTDPAPATFGNVKTSNINSFVTSTPAPNLLSKQAEPSSKPNSVDSTIESVVSKSLFGDLTSKTTNNTSSGISVSSSNFVNFPFGEPSKSFTNVISDLAKRADQADDVEEFVPTAEFKSVIPLPELVPVVTGEENEIMLYEGRGKLLRFDKSLREWKERGEGFMRLMQQKNDHTKVRMVMRRDQTYKVCCNQHLLPDTKFTYAKNSDKSITWAGQDWSEGSLSLEMLCMRFKQADTCKEFYDAVLKVQADMLKEKPIDPADLIVKPTVGFGDAFKPKAGSWSCTGCYTNNNASNLYCLACEAPKDDTVPPKPPALEQSGALNLSSTAEKFNFGFPPAAHGFRFGAISTTENKVEAPSIAKTTSAPLNNLFGTTTTAASNTPAVTTSSGFGDAFKPKPGSWNCNDCYTSNSGDKLYCVSCEAPKDDSVPKKNNALKSNIEPVSNQKFSFGFGTSAAAPPKAATGNNSFVFAVQDQTNTTASNAFESPFSGISSFTFKPAAATTTATTTIPSTTTSATAPATTAATTAVPSLFSNTFSFSMPKPQQQQQQQPKSPDVEVNNDDEGHVEEEENNAYFAPVIPLPDKIDVKTGEEDEDLLYVQRAKLYRLADEGEWKERGLGNVKILRHKETKHLRVVMRREQVLKICLNHVLNSNVVYKPKDEKSWLFVVYDFSEGESILERLALRFKNAEIAQAFHNAVNSAIVGTAEPITEEENSMSKSIVSTPSKATDVPTEHKQCSGCRGCEPDNFDYGESPKVEPEFTPLALALPELKMPSPKQEDNTNKSTGTPSSNKTLLKASTLESTSTGPNFGSFGGFSSAVSANSTATTVSSFKKEDSVVPPKSGFLFGNSEKPVFGQSIFGGNSSAKPKESIFGNALTGTDKVENQKVSIFGSSFKPMTITGDKAEDGGGKSIFGSSTLASNTTFTFGSNLTAKTTTAPVQDNKENIVSSTVSSQFLVPPESKPVTNFSDLAAKATDDFASLAAKGGGNPIGFQKSQTGGFFGLTHQDDFKNFLSPNSSTLSTSGTGEDKDAVTDDHYDPHYDPIIELPNEVVVSTGEEDETKLFGERATLYRYVSETKEWKERGVGELKILKHKTLNTCRLVMRREQIHKLVLNMGIGASFTMDYMNEQKKSFIWASVNYAESTDGDFERLACRFKKLEIADQFFTIINSCKKEAKESVGVPQQQQEIAVETKAH